MMINIIYGILLVTGIGLLRLIYKRLTEISNHLKGIEANEIIAISDEPETRSRSDEEEWRIQQEQKKNNILIEED